MALLDMTILIVLVVVIIAAAAGIGAFLYMRRKKAPAQPPGQPPSPWAQPPAGTMAPAPGQPQPGYPPQQAFVPPTVERPPQAFPAPQPASQAPQAAPFQPPQAPVPAPFGQQAPVYQPQQFQPAPQPQTPAPPAPQPAPDTSRTSYFGQPSAPPSQPGPMQTPAPPGPAPPQPAVPVQSTMPSPAPYTPPIPETRPSVPAVSMPAPAAPAAGPEMRHFTKKIILIGDGGVGKTTLIRKFVYDMFDDKYIATIGTKVSKKKVVFPETLLDVNLMVWDVQGQRNDPLLTRYFAGAEGAFFVCDVTRFQTFENLPEWIKDFESVCGKVPMVILGNKSDLVDAAQFGESELGALAARYNAKAFLTSAKSGANVESSFKDIARAITK